MTKQEKSDETDKLQWIERNWMKIDVISELTFEIWRNSLFILPMSPDQRKLRTCKVFGTLSTRINVTFGILRFLSLGVAPAKWGEVFRGVNVSIFRQSNIWFLHTDKWTLCILDIPFLQQFWYCICFVVAVSRPGEERERERDHSCLVLILVWECLCDSQWVTAQGQRKQHEKLGLTVLRGNTSDRLKVVGFSTPTKLRPWIL